jgi:TonB family protein
MPSYSPGPQLATRQFSGTLAVTIDEQGRVESAEVAKPTLPTYDAALLRAVRSWRYRPATKDGLPVKYRKVYQIVLSPASTR